MTDTWTIPTALEQIRRCGFKCPGGSLENNVAWRWLVGYLGEVETGGRISGGEELANRAEEIFDRVKDEIIARRRGDFDVWMNEMRIMQPEMIARLRRGKD